MIYLEKNNLNKYTVRIGNTLFKDRTSDIEDKVFSILLKNTVTGETFDKTFSMQMFEPYFQGQFTQELTDGEYEYTLSYEESEDTAVIVECGLLRMGDFSDAEAVKTYNPETQTGDIVYNG